jgi:N utilization substance protein B
MKPRRKARILAVQALYSWDIARLPKEEILEMGWAKESPDEEDNDEEDRAYEEMAGAAHTFALLLIAGTLENIELIDKTIRDRLEHWDFNRLARVDLAILRMSVYCLLFQRDIPVTVVIDEAIDISKDFGSDDSYRFINGMLDGIGKSLH